MARSQAKLLVTIWSDDDWLATSAAAQRLYWLLLSQSRLNLAGCVDLMPGRWAALAPDTTVGDIESALAELEERRFVVVDQVTCEVLIRSFTAHDFKPGQWNKNLSDGLWRGWEGILSPKLRRVVVENLPEWLWERSADARPSAAERMRRSPRLEPDPKPRSQPEDEARSEPEGAPRLERTSTSTSTSTNRVVAPPPKSNGHALELVAPSPPATDAVRTVFDAWREATGKQGTVLDKTRSKVIRKALDDYPLDDVLDAVRGWRHDPHNRGENDRRRPFNDLGLLLRDSERIERFRDLERGDPSTRAGPTGPRCLPVLQRLAEGDQ